MGGGGVEEALGVFLGGLLWEEECRGLPLNLPLWPRLASPVLLLFHSDHHKERFSSLQDKLSTVLPAAANAHDSN